MRIVILHYHLRTGGVSSVIRSQARCLKSTPRAAEVHMLLGEQPVHAPNVLYSVLPGLSYDAVGTEGERTASPESSARLADAIEGAIYDRFRARSDIIHAHNALIKKNAALVGALSLLVGRGWKILIQEHDFAEDFRPEMYLRNVEYPSGCFYAVINERDHANLAAAGLDPSTVFLLPNQIEVPPTYSPRTGYRKEIARGRPLALYPVRAIRRKNMGEALILSRSLPEDSRIAVTLPPTSPADLPAYSRWRAKAKSGGYNISFEEGLHSDLDSLYARSFCAISTSVKEGFGFSFLDPLTRGIPVVGRSIPVVVADFRKAGVAMEGLYQGIRVPKASVPVKPLAEALSGSLSAMRVAYAEDYDRENPGKGGGGSFESVLAALAAKFEGPLLDFGALDEQSQASILDRYSSDQGFIRELRQLNPFLEALFDTHIEPAEAARLRSAIRDMYEDSAYRERLFAAYHAAMEREPSGAIDRKTLLASMLEPEGFFLGAS